MNHATLLKLKDALDDVLLQTEIEKAFSIKEELLNKKEELLAEAESLIGSDSESLVTPIEDCITTFLDKCTAEGRLPTLDEAQSIYILDQINSKYN